jgi:hypothetical protein
MSESILFILMGIFILSVIVIAANARSRPIEPEYRRNKLANELKWLKVGMVEVERRLKDAKKCACNTQAAGYLERVKAYHARAEDAVKGLNNETILAAENELTAHQQLLANARAHLERAEHEQCDSPEDGRLGGCGE